MSNNLHKVYYVDKMAYEGEQLMRYVENIKMTRNQKAIISEMKLCNFNATKAAKQLNKTQQSVSESWRNIRRKIYKYLDESKIKSPVAKRYSIRYTIDDVRKEFEKEGYILITDQYNRQTDKLEYVCPEGHKGVTTFQYWKHNHQRCQICHEREYGNGNYNLKSAERNKEKWINKRAYVYFVKMFGSGECFYQG